jgi:hypothetical protein
MPSIKKLLQAAAGNAGADTGLQWVVSANNYTRIYSLDETTDAVSEVDLTSDIESAYGADWSHDQSILYTVEDISGTTYFRAWDWTNGRQGSLIAQTAAPAAAGAFCMLMCNRGMGSVNGVEMLGYYTSSNLLAYIVVFNGTSFTTTATITAASVQSAIFRNLAFSKDGSAIILGIFKTSSAAVWYSVNTSGAIGSKNTINPPTYVAQHAVFSQGGTKILIAQSDSSAVYNKQTGNNPTTLQYDTANAVGVDCNSDGLTAWNVWGVGWFSESSPYFTPFSTYPNQFSTYFELSISDSNLVDNDIRYILCQAYTGPSRIYKVNTNLETVTDLGAPYSGNLNVTNIIAAR